MSQSDAVLSPEMLGFDPAELAARYSDEREKRLRADAEAQFVQVDLSLIHI